MTTGRLDLGRYARDRRLVEHDDRHATFFGDRANPGVGVQRVAGGFAADQSGGSVALDGGDLIGMPGPRTNAYPTAAEALQVILGPPQTRRWWWPW